MSTYLIPGSILDCRTEISSYGNNSANLFSDKPITIKTGPITDDASQLKGITVDTQGDVTIDGSLTVIGGGGGVSQIIPGANVTITPSGGTGAVTINATGSGGGTVTSIIAGTGLSGGTITTSGTIALATTGVTAGSYYGDLMSTVNTSGQLTAITSSPLIYNVRNYGAYCDGVHDDTVAVKAAIAAQQAASQPGVVIVPGVCLLGTNSTTVALMPLTAQMPFFIKGCGRGISGLYSQDLTHDILAITYNINSSYYATPGYKQGITVGVEGLYFQHVTGGNSLSNGAAYPTFGVSGSTGTNLATAGSANATFNTTWCASTCGLRVTWSTTGTQPTLHDLAYGGYFNNLMFQGSYIGFYLDGITSYKINDVIMQGSGYQYRGSYNYGTASCGLCLRSTLAIGEGDGCVSDVFIQGYTVGILVTSGGGLKMNNVKVDYSSGPGWVFDMDNSSGYTLPISGYGQSYFTNCCADNPGNIVFNWFLENVGAFSWTNSFLGGSFYLASKYNSSWTTNYMSGFTIQGGTIGGVWLADGTTTNGGGFGWSTVLPPRVSGLVCANTSWNGYLFNGHDPNSNNITFAGNVTNSSNNGNTSWLGVSSIPSTSNLTFDFVNGPLMTPLNVTASANSGGSITLSWSVSYFQANGYYDSGSESYTILYRANGTGSFTSVSVVGSGSGTQSHTLTGLTVSSLYFASVGVDFSYKMTSITHSCQLNNSSLSWIQS